MLFDCRTDQEARAIHKENQRDVERVAQPYESSSLVGRVHVDRAAEEHRLIGDDAGRPAAEAREARDDRARPLRLHREEVAIVGKQLDDLAHVVRLSRVGRDDVVQLFATPLDGIS